MYMEKDEMVFYRVLRNLQDEDGIVRCSPEYLTRELDMLEDAIEDLLLRMCDKEILVYVTRTNKSTGEVLKVIQLI